MTDFVVKDMAKWHGFKNNEQTSAPKLIIKDHLMCETVAVSALVKQHRQLWVEDFLKP